MNLGHVNECAQQLEPKDSRKANIGNYMVVKNPLEEIKEKKNFMYHLTNPLFGNDVSVNEESMGLTTTKSSTPFFQNLGLYDQNNSSNNHTGDESQENISAFLKAGPKEVNADFNLMMPRVRSNTGDSCPIQKGMSTSASAASDAGDKPWIYPVATADRRKSSRAGKKNEKTGGIILHNNVYNLPV